MTDGGPTVFDLGSLLAYEEPIRPYLIRGLLYPGSKMIMGGTAKRGKSFILHGMLLSMARGVPVFGNPAFEVPGPMPGVLFSQELGPGELRRRWAMHLNGSGPVNGLLVVPRDLDVRLDTDGGRQTLCRTLDAAAETFGAPPAWVALDPISKFHTLNENEQQNVAALMRVLEAVQARYGNCAIILIHHFGHPSEVKQMYRHSGGLLRGSTHFYADADTIISVDRRSPINARAPKFKVNFETRHGEPIDPGWIQLDAEKVLPHWLGTVPREERGERPADPD